MKLTMMKVVDHIIKYNLTIHNKRIRSDEIDYDEGW
jgi:hypothetical protein